MGDGADMALDDCMDYEDDMEDFRMGNMETEEAYDKGLVDEVGAELEPEKDPEE